MCGVAGINVAGRVSVPIDMLTRQRSFIEEREFDVGFGEPSLDIPIQLDSMRGLEDGWLEGGGIAPNAEGLDWLAETSGRHYPEDSPRPHLYPTEDGGVQAEWSLSHWRVSLEIDLNSRCGSWFALNLETDDADERQLRCDEAPDWRWLVRRIHDLS